jgi:hypothetical protein
MTDVSEIPSKEEILKNMAKQILLLLKERLKELLRGKEKIR